jgi:hypothetical protein
MRRIIAIMTLVTLLLSCTETGSPGGLSITDAEVNGGYCWGFSESWMDFAVENTSGDDMQLVSVQVASSTLTFEETYTVTGGGTASFDCSGKCYQGESDTTVQVILTYRAAGGSGDRTTTITAPYTAYEYYDSCEMVSDGPGVCRLEP